MTKAEVAQAEAIDRLTDKFFDVMPGDMEVADMLSALVIVAGFAFCSTADSKTHALEGAAEFCGALMEFIDSEFDVVFSTDTGGVH